MVQAPSARSAEGAPGRRHVRASARRAGHGSRRAGGDSTWLQAPRGCFVKVCPPREDLFELRLYSSRSRAESFRTIQFSRRTLPALSKYMVAYGMIHMGCTAGIQNLGMKKAQGTTEPYRITAASERDPPPVSLKRNVSQKCKGLCLPPPPI